MLEPPATSIAVRQIKACQRSCLLPGGWATLKRAMLRLPMASVALGLLVSGCSTRGNLEFTTLMSEVPAAQAIVVPPPGGPSVVAVLERRYKNGVSQEIALSTAAEGVGQNTFWVSMINDPKALTEVDDSLRIGQLDPLKIYNETEERLPGINTTTSSFFVQNKYGPFGYAVGRSGAGDTCIYAWQDIEPTENAIFQTNGKIALRLRMCEAGATETQLLRLMYGYTISGYFNNRNWNPYGTPPPVSPYLGQIDSPIYPMGTSGASLQVAPPTVLPGTAPVARAAAAPSRPRRAAPAARPAPAASTRPADPRASGYPIVPPPPS